MSLSNNLVSYLDNTLLSDILLVYNDGSINKAINCRVFTKNTTLHDDKLTIVYCKKTNTFIVYMGIYKFKDDITLVDENGVTINHLTGLTDSGKMVNKQNIQIMRMRDLITMYPDVKFINLPNKSKLCNINNLVYGIEYISSKTGKYKHAMLVSKYFGSKKNIHSGFIKYFNKMNDKLKSKSSILIVTDYDTWKSYYPETKIIKIQQQTH